jgi:hypothetical protein
MPCYRMDFEYAKAQIDILRTEIADRSAQIDNLDSVVLNPETATCEIARASGASGTGTDSRGANEIADDVYEQAPGRAYSPALRSAQH